MTTSRHLAFRLPLLAALSAASALLPGAASAQPAPVAAASAPQGQQTVRSMFAFADSNRDGRLTRDEARGHLPITYSRFADIDTERRGSISFEQFLAFTNKRVGKQADDILKIGQRL